MAKLIIKIISFAPVKLLGILAILYYALYANTDKPQSLGNRITKEEVKKNLDKAKQTTGLILRHATQKTPEPDPNQNIKQK